MLVLTNLQTLNAGLYSVVVNNAYGSAASRMAHLELDQTLTKITTDARLQIFY